MADFLKLAGDVVKKKEKQIMANSNMFVLNQAQCTRLWRNLAAVYDAFAPSLSYSSATQQKCLPLYKEFYNLATRAEAIVERCSTVDESWLKEAVFLGGNRQAFRELSVDLQSSAALIHYLTRSLCRDSHPANIAVAIRDDVLDEDFYKDVASLRRRLEEKQGEAEQHGLTTYLFERERTRSSGTVGIPNADILPFYEVYHEDSVHVRNVGSGAAGIVSEVKWLGVTCAKKEFLNVVSVDAFVKEVSTLVALNHSRIVKLLCSSREMPTPWFMMEFMPMNLTDFIHQHKCTDEVTMSDTMPFEILATINMMLQISSGMEYLHEQGVVHRDLKSLNILVAPSAHPGLRGEGYADIKLTDFGLAKMKVYGDSMVPTGRMGTIQWIAPEVLEIPRSPAPGQSRIDWRKADIYSFAIVCSEILTGHTPYSGMLPGKAMMESVALGRLRPKLPQDCPTYLSAFMSQCWAHNPKDRPTFKEITQTLTAFKTSLLICSVPKPQPASVVPLLKNVWSFGRVLKKRDSLRGALFCPNPDEKELVEAAIEYIYSRMEMMDAICSRMKEHLKVAQVCHVQCGYLVQKYLEGVRKVNNIVSPVDLWKLYQSKKLHQLSGSMDRFICSMMAVEELVRACGGNGWEITALGVFAVLPWTRTYSIFGLYLGKLHWNLFVINHAMHDITTRQSITSDLRLLSASNNVQIQWCKERCTLVFRRITSTGYEDVEEDVLFLEADAFRQVEDRKNLLAFLDQKSRPHESLFLSSCCFPPDVPAMEDGLVLFMKKKLQSTSASLNFESLQFEELHFEAGKTIGMGFQKNVVRCKWFGETVAIALLEGFVSEHAFRHEVEMLARLQHPNVVHFVGCKWDGNRDCGYIVMELMEQDLRRLIERNRQLYSISTFPLLVTIDILLQIVEAMIHLHRSGVIYRDLKPSNILVSPKTKFNAHQDLDVYYIVKLTDFQTATKCCTTSNREAAFEVPLNSDSKFYTMGVGTKGYQAPELMSKLCNGDPRYTFSVDVYSFGMTAYHVITGSHPFELMPGREVEQRVLQGERPPLPNVCAQGVKELIKKCWAGNPHDRPCFEEIRKDLWTMKYHEELK